MLTLDVFILVVFSYFSFKFHSRLPALFGSLVTSPSSQLVQRGFDYAWSVALTLLPLFASVFFGSPALSAEIETRTAYNVFPLPVSRYVLHVGKFLAAYTATFIVLGIVAVGQFVDYYLIYHSLQMLDFYYSFFFSLLFALAALSITFLVSAIFNKNLYAYITVFVIYFLGLTSINLIVLFLYNYSPSYLLDNAASIISRVYINLNILGFSFTGSLSPASFANRMFDLSILLLYAAIPFVVSLVIFDRRQVL